MSCQQLPFAQRLSKTVRKRKTLIQRSPQTIVISLSDISEAQRDLELSIDFVERADSIGQKVRELLSGTTGAPFGPVK